MTERNNPMPLKEMPGFIFSHKQVRNAVICSLASCFLLLLQLILMRRTLITVLFDVILPFNGAVIFGCYAITMAMDRPAILIYPPTIYFVSLLVSQLLSVEVGVEETYPVFIFVEFVPYLFYCVSVGTGKIKKITRGVLIAGCVIIVLFSVVACILAAVFRIMLYSRVSQTFALVAGLLSILCIYIGMLEQLKIAGCQKRVRERKIRLFF